MPASIGIREARRAGLIPLFFLAATLDLGFGSIFALLAEIRVRFGFDAAGIGWIAGAGMVSSVIAQSGLSRLADRGHARAMVAVGLTMASLALLSLVFANTLIAFIAARFVYGFGEGCFFPAARRIVVSHDPSRAGEWLGLLTAFQMSGFLLGPALASLLCQQIGLSGTFSVFFVLLLGAALLPLRAGKPTTPIAARDTSLRGLIGQPAYQGMLLVAVGFFGSLGVFEAMWAVLLTDLGATQLTIGVSFSLFTLPMIVIAPLAGRLAGRVGGQRVTLLTLGIAAPCMALYGAAVSLPAVFAIMVLHAFVDAFLTPASQLAVAEATPSDRIAEGQGVFAAVGLTAAALCALTSGAVYDRFGPAVLFGGWALVMLICLAAAAWRCSGQGLGSTTSSAS